MSVSTANAHRFRFRAAASLLLVILVWGAIGLRLAQISWTHGGTFSNRGSRQRTVEEVIPARPGDIVDRRARLLATTVTAYSVFVNPSCIEQPWETAQLLAEALELDADALFRKLSENRQRQFLWVRRRVSDEQRAAVSKLPLPRDVLGLRPEYLRHYPNGSLAAHVLGLRDIDGRGRGGVEETCDDLLRGEPGSRRLSRDALGRAIAIDEVSQSAPRSGETLQLTIDGVLQWQVEQELDQLMRERVPKAACAIVMDPRNGEVLALASRPTYDPNAAGNVRDEAWKNLAVAASYEPGSTFKPFVVAWALQTGAIDRDARFDCEQGAYRMGRRVLHDHHPYGELSLTDVLVKSSNIGMAKIGERLGNEGLYEAAHLFGFGRRTGIPLPGELEGTLRPLSAWTSYSTGSIPMGQELAVTPMQMITAHCALANDGRWQSPRLLRGVASAESFSGRTPRFDLSSVVSETVEPEVARWVIREPLVQVVERGTGKQARIAGYRVFGKTGTAQKIDPETGKISHRHHLSSFLCGAPAEEPRALVLVVVDEPSEGGSYFGGVVAAPHASRILEETLRLLEFAPEPDRLAADPATPR